MKNLGRATVAVMTVALLCATVLGVRSIGDVKRYLQMRKM